jgi:tetratricopeptide (TPR) repeat protein
MERRGIHRQIICVVTFFGMFALTAGAAGPSTQPWAIRRMPSGNLLIVEDSSIAVPIPAGYLNGETGDGPVILSRDGSKVWIYVWAESADGFGPQAADGAMNTIKQAMGGALIADTLKAEDDPHYPLQIRYAFNDCHRANVLVLERWKPMGDGVLHVCASAQASAPEAVAGLDKLSDAIFAGARTIQRKPVLNHEEVLPGVTATGAGRPMAWASVPTDSQSVRARNGAGVSGSAKAGAMAGATTQPSAAEQTAAAKSQKAESMLEAAEKLQSDGKDDQAYARFKTILVDYANTPSAAAARAAVDKYESDTAFAQRHKRPDPTPAERAAALLSLADNYVSLGKLDAAKDKYDQLLSDYPNTPSAVTAKARLADLAKR